MNKKKALAAGGAAAVTLLMAVPAFAATIESPSVSSDQHKSFHVGKMGQAKSPNLSQAAFGTVASISDSSFTLTRKTENGNATVTIGTDGSTAIKKNGRIDTSTDIAVGQRVVAMGVKDSSGNIADATSVNIMVRTK